jgi:hypothetical protein
VHGLRLYDPRDRGSDRDTYVKPIQNARASAASLEPVQHVGSSIKGDERIDHLDRRSKRVRSKEGAGPLAEVWALQA